MAFWGWGLWRISSGAKSPLGFIQPWRDELKLVPFKNSTGSPAMFSPACTSAPPGVVSNCSQGKRFARAVGRPAYLSGSNHAGTQSHWR